MSSTGLIDPPNFLIGDLEGMKILPKVTQEITNQSKDLCPDGCTHGDTDSVRVDRIEPDEEEVKPLTGGGAIAARTLPKRPPMRPYPKEGNHVALPDETLKKFETQRRQLEALNKRFQKGKVSEKSYLHQAKSIMT